MVAALQQWVSEIVTYGVPGGSRDHASLGPKWTFGAYPDHGTIPGEKPLVSTQSMTGSKICRSKVNRCKTS